MWLMPDDMAKLTHFPNFFMTYYAHLYCSHVWHTLILPIRYIAN